MNTVLIRSLSIAPGGTLVNQDIPVAGYDGIAVLWNVFNAAGRPRVNFINDADLIEWPLLSLTADVLGFVYVFLGSCPALISAVAPIAQPIVMVSYPFVPSRVRLVASPVGLSAGSIEVYGWTNDIGVRSP